MSMKYAYNRRLTTARWIVLSAALAIPCAALPAGVRTGTTIGGPGGKRTIVGTGVITSRSSPTPQVVRGNTTAFFTKWGTHTENATTMLTMYVTIDNARRTQKIILPNAKPNSVVIDPGPKIKKLAETLRIGDAVHFFYMIVGNRIYGTSVKLVKPLGKGPGDAPFTFIGRKMVRAGKQKVMTVTANAGVIPCTFRVPEEVDDRGKSKPSSKVADALKQFCRGDLIDLEYKTVNYQFVLTGVKAARKTGQGVIVKVLDRRIKGFPHKVAMIKTARRTMTLVDPEAIIPDLKLKGVDNPTPDPPVQTALKTLQPGDFVMFTYRRQRAVYWLDEIYPASRPEEIPTPETKGNR